MSKSPGQSDEFYCHTGANNCFKKEVIGLEEEQILGMNWFDNFIPKNISEEIKDVFNNILIKKAEFTSSYENIIINSSGEERIIHWNITILYG